MFTQQSSKRQNLLYSNRQLDCVGSQMRKRQVDALTIKPGPAEDGLAAGAPTPPPAATDYTTLIVVAAVVVVVVLVSFFLYMKKRKKPSAK